MHKDLFDQAIGEVPPSTVDVDAAISRERRAAWVRRAANPWVATAAAVVAVTFGVAVAIMPGSPDPVVGGIAPTSPTTPPPQSPPGPGSKCDAMPTATAPAAPEQPAVAAERLTGVFTAAVRQHLQPGAQLVANPAAEYPPGTKHGPLEFFYVFSAAQEIPNGCQGGEDYFMSRANVVQAGKKGNILALVGRLGGNASPETDCVSRSVSPEQTFCERRDGSNGEIIVLTTLALQDGPTMHRVGVTKTDGTGVLVHAENVADDSKKGGPPQSPTPPLTHEQLLAIALDPGATLYPR